MTQAVLVEPAAAVRDGITAVLDDGGPNVISLACGWDIDAAGTVTGAA
jgi:hypothetical protein